MGAAGLASLRGYALGAQHVQASHRSDGARQADLAPSPTHALLGVPVGSSRLSRLLPQEVLPGGQRPFEGTEGTCPEGVCGPEAANQSVVGLDAALGVGFMAFPLDGASSWHTPLPRRPGCTRTQSLRCPDPALPLLGAVWHPERPWRGLSRS